MSIEAMGRSLPNSSDQEPSRAEERGCERAGRAVVKPNQNAGITPRQIMPASPWRKRYGVLALEWCDQCGYAPAGDRFVGRHQMKLDDFTGAVGSALRCGRLRPSGRLCERSWSRRWHSDVMKTALDAGLLTTATVDERCHAGRGIFGTLPRTPAGQKIVRSLTGPD